MEISNHEPIINIAIRAARKAGDIIAHALQRRDELVISEKGQNDFVTNIDHRAEEAIINVIHTAYPSHAILAEERGHLNEENSDEYTWIIDPLDGTTNFIHGYPHLAVSIGIMLNNRCEHAVIYDPIRQDLFSTSRGKGAQLNSRRIRVSQRKELNGALLSSTFPYESDEHFAEYLEAFIKLYNQVAGIRRGGSSVLDLAYVAAGYLDAYWAGNLKPWDLAAGSLLIREAGGLTSDFNGAENFMETGQIIAANPKLYRKLLPFIKPEILKKKN